LSSVPNLESLKRRGWVAFGAGAFLIVFMGGIAIWIDRLFASDAVQRTPATDTFLGRINVAFALVIVSGILGVINGWNMAHTGRRNRVLLFALLVVFVAALFVACSASNAMPPS
jgi:Na+/H+-dicarboxylate symporter